MSGGKTILQKVFRLFVNDAFLAVAALLWLTVVWLLLPRIFVSAMWRGVIEFSGLAVILMASVLHRARRT